MRLGAQLFLVKISFIHDFHIQGWALTLVLKQRPWGTGKWPILNVQCKLSSRTLVTASLSGKLFLWPPPQNAVFSTPSGQFQLRTPFSRSEDVRLLEIPLYCVSCIWGGGVARCGVSTRLSHWHGFKSRPVDAICGLSFLLVLSLVSRVFFLRVLYCTVQ